MRSSSRPPANRDYVGLVTTIMLFLTTTVLLGSVLANAQTFTVIHNFTNGADGSNPQSLVLGPGGNLYGPTFAGATGFGEVYELKHNGTGWTFNPLYGFAGGNDGAGPQFLTFNNGALYGTTEGGGGGGSCPTNNYPGCGTAFKMMPPATFCPTFSCAWTETVLHRFTGVADGWAPRAPVFNMDNFFGTTAYGADSGCAFDDGCGAVFELSPSGGRWTENTLYSFTGGADGGNPDDGAATFDSAGNFYGSTVIGGSSACGTVFQLSRSGSGWTENVIHNFAGGSDGGGPYSGLISDSSGNLYGATYGGSTFGSCAGADATVFEFVNSNGVLTYTRIYDFGCTQCGPLRAPVMDSAGNLWGATYLGGANRYGMVFELTFSNGTWMLHDIHDFTGGSDGAYPGEVLFDASGNLFGVASEGGTSANCSGGCGVVFEITP
jgi:uncharacterized repeat protein (TIGR03803 family)